MTAVEAATSQDLQQQLLNKFVQLSLEGQKQVVAFVEELLRPEIKRPSLWEAAQEYIKDVPPDAWAEVPADGALNHDHYLYGAPKRYNPDGSRIEP